GGKAKDPVEEEWKAYKKLKKALKVTHDREQNLIHISLDFVSPVLAKEWLDLIVKDMNNQIRDEEVDIAQRNIAYLRRQIQETNITPIQAAFSQMIQEQIKTVMLAEATDEYALKTIDPAIVPHEKARPQRALLGVLGIFIGILIGMMAALLRQTLRKTRTATK